MTQQCSHPVTQVAGGSFSSVRGGSGRVLVRIQDRMAVAICSVEQGKDLFQWRVKNAHFIAGARLYGADTEIEKSEDNIYHPPGLRLIHGFCEDLWHSQAYKQGKAIVVCAGTHPRDITDTALLVGSFMILSMDYSVEKVASAFEPIAHLFLTYCDQLAVSDCWSALHHAFARCGWLDIGSRHFLGPKPARQNAVDALDMREYVHYDSPLNGGFHAIVPDKLFVFNCPADLPDCTPWVDAGGERRFGAAYYADVFSDFGVDVVVRCCDAEAGGGYDAGAFAARGIEVRRQHIDSVATVSLTKVSIFVGV